MSLSDDLLQKIAARDVKSVRRNLVNYLMVGEGFRTFDEALREVQRLLPEVMETYDETPLNEEASSWNKDAVASAQNALMANFSLERIRHLKRMIRRVFPETALPVVREKRKEPDKTPTFPDVVQNVCSKVRDFLDTPRHKENVEKIRRLDGLLEVIRLDLYELKKELNFKLYKTQSKECQEMICEIEARISRIIQETSRGF